MISETTCLKKKSVRTAQNIKNTFLLETSKLSLIIEKKSAISGNMIGNCIK